MLDHARQNSEILDQFEKQAEAYAALMLRNPDNSLRALLEIAQPRLDDRMLDVGCGTGRLALSLARLVHHVTGIDLTPAMLNQARTLQAELGISNIEWREGDVTALPFPDGCFSLVTCRSMLHHCVSPKNVMAEMRRVCAPNGRIAVTDLTPAAGKSAAFDAIEILRDPSHVHAMPTEELRAIGATLGLREVGVHSDQVRLPLEAVLATSCPPETMLDRVRQLYRQDAESGADALGLAASLEDGVVSIAYPSTLLVWDIA